MARKATVSEIRAFLVELGLDKNPIERITHHKNGSVTIWVVGLAKPVSLEAPAPPARTRATSRPPSSAAPPAPPRKRAKPKPKA